MQVCNIFCYPDRNFITASLPLPRLHVYVRRLVEAGHKASITPMHNNTLPPSSMGPVHSLGCSFHVTGQPSSHVMSMTVLCRSVLPAEFVLCEGLQRHASHSAGGHS